MKKIAFLFALCVGLFWWSEQGDPFADAPVGYIEDEPVQMAVYIPAFGMSDYSFFGHEYVISPEASYDIKGRVLHTRRYFSDKYSGSLATHDLGLGWQGMSDTANLSGFFRFGHWAESGGGRFLTWEYGLDGQGLPKGLGSLDRLFSNNHIIPANKNVFRQLGSIKQGDLIRLQGYLVAISDPERPEWKWTTSTTRTDTSTHWGGNNTSCETIYVTNIERIVSTEPYLSEPMPEWFWPF